MMTANMGMTDRIVRLVLAAVLILAAVLGWLSGVWAVLALVFAAVFVVTSLVRVCPLYLPFGLKTTGKTD